MRFQEEVREWIFPGLLYVNDLVLCGKSEEDLRAMVDFFCFCLEVCRRCLKVNAGKGKVMVLGGEEGLEWCEVCVDGIRLEHVSAFKYMGCVLDEFGTDEVACSKKVASGRNVAGAIRSQVLGSCMRYCWCLLLRMVVRQRYGRRMRDLE